MEFGTFVRMNRENKELSLREAAHCVGVNPAYLSRVEAGKVPPSDQLVFRLASLLACTEEELLLLAGKLPIAIQDFVKREPYRAAMALKEVATMQIAEPEATYGEPLRKEHVTCNLLNRGTFQTQQPCNEMTAEHTVNNSTVRIGRATVVNTDCIEWLRDRAPNSIHAVVTDPPYGLREYNEVEKAKLRAGRGGVWRIPPTFDGCRRMPLPRFTTLTNKEQFAMREFFAEWASLLHRVLVPGGHVFVASNPLVSHLVYMPLLNAGFEKRGEIIRLVQTLRGGDRPKNAENEFGDVTVMPRSAWEPWGLFRKPCDGLVHENLRKWFTGGLRRESTERPFTDVIVCSPTRSAEREIANHPSLKPQSYMRQVVRAALPLAKGVVLDPFMGGGSTIAAAEFNGYESIGLEADSAYFELAVKAIPRLAAYTSGKSVSVGKDLKPVSRHKSNVAIQSSLFD
ncbi:MAG: DNA methyltransferase [Myxococcota bacterium]|jgi:site-specific DNA-methyltransferase (adenine-specific)